jgi:glycosyltransferase involved in cell wall biosynthesis
MNILFVHPYNWTQGPDIVLLNLIKFINRSKFNCFCLLPAPRELSDTLQKYGVKIQYCPELGVIPRTYNPLKLIYYFINLFKTVRFIKQVAQRYEIDLIHTSEIAFWGSGIAARMCGIPSISHCQSLTVFSPRLIGLLNAKVINKVADRVICVSYAVSKTLSKVGLAESKLSVVYNGVDLSKFNDLNNINDYLKKELRIGGNEHPIIGMIGGLDPRKGHKYFIEAASLIKEKFPNILFIIVGASPVDKTRKLIQEQYWNELQRLVVHFQLDNSLLFIGERADIPELINMMDILIQPSEIEAGPLVPLESMACGKPVIATDVGGLPEYLEHGRTAIIVPPRDPHAIARAAISLLQDRKKLLRMGELGRERVSRLFDVRQKVSEIEKIYELINENKKNGYDQGKSGFSGLRN